MVRSEDISWLHLRYPQKDEDGFTEEVQVIKGNFEWVKVECNGDPFGDYPKRTHSTLTNKETCKEATAYPIGATVLFVNEWNDTSFIGGGGSRENSMNGWTVAGGSEGFDNLQLKDIDKDLPHLKKMGANAKNYSFLHNVFFTPELLDEKNWL